MLCRNNFRWPGASQFLRDERGTLTIESMLWLPVFVVILVIAIDATVLYLHHTEMWNVARDVARRVAIGDITEAEAAAAVQNEMFLYGDAYSVATSNPADPDVQIVIQTPMSDASVFGAWRLLMDRNLTATVIMRREPI